MKGEVSASVKILDSYQPNSSEFFFHQYWGRCYFSGQLINVEDLRQTLESVCLCALLCVLCRVDLHNGQHITSTISSEHRLQSIKVNDPTKLKLPMQNCVHVHANSLAQIGDYTEWMKRHIIKYICYNFPPTYNTSMSHGHFLQVWNDLREQGFLPVSSNFTDTLAEGPLR